jgi:copper chaperone CopZ
METIEFKAQNIKCMGCVSTIQDGLKTLSGIDKVDVDVDSKQVTISGHELSKEEIIDKITALGYPLA